MQFKTKIEEKAYFRQMLNRYEPGQRVNPNDYRDLLELLQKHSECKQKTGCGIVDFSVMIAPQGSKCFQIIRSDSSKTDFSYLHCIRGRAKDIKQQVHAAFRQVIHKDIQNFKNKAFDNYYLTATCAVTGELLSRNEAHVDHAVPVTFEYIVNNFIDDFNLEYKDIEIAADEDNQTFTHIVDKALAEKFREYHNKIAVLRIVKDKVNLSTLKKESCLNDK
jgi:hypothetical protein